jgi:methylated-DNA-protein-cysteine methyltransferase related protein
VSGRSIRSPLANLLVLLLDVGFGRVRHGPVATRSRGRITLVAFEDDVLAVLHRLRPGEIVTYGEVAEEAGHPGAARAVGGLLAKGEPGVPWWRVVTATGRLVPGHETEHARRLRGEGVDVADGRVRRPHGRR